MTYCVWFLSLSMFSRSIVACISTLFLLSGNILLYGYTTFYPSISWLAFGLSPLFGYYEECCYKHFMGKFLCGHIPSFLLGIYRRMEFLGHMVTLYINMLWTCQTVFQKLAGPFYIHISIYKGILISSHLHQHLLISVL